ncbi:acyltransferase family protein [Alteriqipengyuania lutimaris]|uniref:Acyltransferase n=1 Tax=Alteriqipengyuania lutimaris TaxID=1538146 RepID=A0A395LKW5_9SPHN|nr:acyltransferase [Alteriqipengyuania lutimaris]MBB3033629.1 peptidoglycan/LPS O-acetylase OafA/YrhL [Alteriqipengyuania lutimaris]RDS77375.1 acyltransferase [Alteriqipengyuania lutimaris]
MVGARSAKKTFDTLNGMRGIAALAVAMMHIQWFLAWVHPAIVSLAVDFFFVLSGFVIAYAYEADLKAGLRRRHFMLARYIRLYPLFLIGLILGAISIWMYELPEDRSLFFGHLAANLFMLPYPLPFPQQYDNLFPLNFPAWSLFYEMVAYALFAILARRLTTSVLIVVIALGLAALIYTGITEGTLDRGTWRPSIIGGMARVTFSFFAGVALHRLWQWRTTRIALHPAIMLVLLALPLLWRPAEGLPLAWLYELAVITVWMPLLVWLGTGSEADGIWRRICAALGAISYPLYVIHAPVYLFAGRYNNWQGSTFMDAHQPWAALALIALLCLLSWLLATYVDLPVRRALSRAFLPRRSSHPTEVERAREGDPVSAP